MVVDANQQHQDFTRKRLLSLLLPSSSSAVVANFAPPKSSLPPSLIYCWSSSIAVPDHLQHNIRRKKTEASKPSKHSYCQASTPVPTFFYCTTLVVSSLVLCSGLIYDEERERVEGCRVEDNRNAEANRKRKVWSRCCCRNYGSSSSSSSLAALLFTLTLFGGILYIYPACLYFILKSVREGERCTKIVCSQRISR